MEIVGEAATAADAMAMAASVRPDVILMDIQMPGCDGSALAFVEARSSLIDGSRCRPLDHPLALGHVLSDRLERTRRDTLPAHPGLSCFQVGDLGQLGREVAVGVEHLQPAPLCLGVTQQHGERRVPRGKAK